MPGTLADRIRQRLDELQISARSASLRATGSDALVRNILIGKSVHPREDTIRKLAEVLEVSPQWLLSGGESGLTELRGEVRYAPEITLPNRVDMPRDVPVYGTVAGSALGRGAFQLTSDVVDFVRRPPGLFGARDAYALYVEGESMSPKFEPGDLVFVHPHRKVAPGDYIVVQEPDSNNGEPQAFIKRFVKLGGSVLRTEQFNPPQTIDFVLRAGLRYHKVLDYGELLGV